MDRRTKWIAGAAVATALVAGGAGFAVANSPTDDQPLSGSALEKAAAAALQHTGAGTVVETEIGDGGAAYGVEIRLEDGRVIEVHLDAAFKVTGQEVDDDGSIEQPDPNDD